MQSDAVDFHAALQFAVCPCESWSGLVINIVLHVSFHTSKQYSDKRRRDDGEIDVKHISKSGKVKDF